MLRKLNFFMILSVIGQYTSRQGQDRQILKLLQIEDIRDKFPYQVSGGQKQRCACARAMVQ